MKTPKSLLAEIQSQGRSGASEPIVARNRRQGNFFDGSGFARGLLGFIVGILLSGYIVSIDLNATNSIEAIMKEKMFYVGFVAIMGASAVELLILLGFGKDKKRYGSIFSILCSLIILACAVFAVITHGTYLFYKDEFDVVLVWIMLALGGFVVLLGSFKPNYLLIKQRR